jgi:hypothetical protein
MNAEHAFVDEVQMQINCKTNKNKIFFIFKTSKIFRKGTKNY